MMDVLAQIAAWLNAAANALGGFLLAPVGVVAGVALGHARRGGRPACCCSSSSSTPRTRHAIKRVRNDINANLLALKLFKDSAPVSLRPQGRLLLGPFRLFVLAIVPMLVMAVPVTLLLGQLAPLVPGSAAPGRRGGRRHAQAQRRCRSRPARREPRADRRRGGRRSVRSACGASARSAGTSRPASRAAIASCSRSATRPSPRNSRSATASCGSAPSGPGWDWYDRSCSTPGEPFRPGDPVHSIEIAYPERPSWTSGTDYVGDLLVRRLDGRRPCASTPR